MPAFVAVLNEEPQPHEAMAFGLSMVKPESYPRWPKR
ncbi:hypothetical protein BSNT_09681 [Bacillus subtilis subsp. natto BEST195]|nr:hypothetical protein BSNT_09681 [Bacillus subtilis subsp. natto BEST195]